jgi:hypothetical protein
MSDPASEEQVMPDFYVIDLASQARAVARYIEGWPPDAVLAWLAQYGDLAHIGHGEDVYAFYSRCGPHTLFRLTRDGQLFIFGDHTMYRVVP